MVGGITRTSECAVCILRIALVWMLIYLEINVDCCEKHLHDLLRQNCIISACIARNVRCIERMLQ
jgi:hypothetical protein